MDAFDLQMSITIKLGEAEGGLGVSTLDLNFEANSTDVRKRKRALLLFSNYERGVFDIFLYDLPN